MSSPAILRFAAAGALPYATVERMTRPLIALDRWPSRARKQLLASDLASLLNAMMGQQAADAATSDTMLRGLEFKSAWPNEAKQTPALGEGTWGDLLERLIRNAPGDLCPTVPATGGMDHSGYLPHGIETCLNPLLIILVWDGKTGAPARREFYGPSFGALPPRYPYGPATLLVRKCFVSSQMITIAGQILRDASAQAIPENETAASPGRVAAAFQNQDQNSIPGGHSPEGKRERRNAQALSSRGPGPSTSPRRKTNGRRHPDTPDPGHVGAEGAD